MNFNEFITSLSKINQELREQSIRAVNTSLTIRNWVFGYYIVEYEQNGNDRAEYGKSLLANISKEMNRLQISNIDERELRRCRMFYTVYSGAAKFIFSNTQIRGLLNPESSGNYIENSLNQIRGTASPESPDSYIENSLTQIRGPVTPEFNIPDNHYITLFNKIALAKLFAFKNSHRTFNYI